MKKLLSLSFNFSTSNLRRNIKRGAPYLNQDKTGKDQIQDHNSRSINRSEKIELNPKIT